MSRTPARCTQVDLQDRQPLAAHENLRDSVTGDADHFELDDFKLKPAAVGERVVGVPTRVKKQNQHFIMVPRRWVDVITAQAKDKTLAVVWHLLYEHWRQDGCPIKVSNGMLGLDGVGRGAKWRVLNMLEKAGLISIDRRDKKSPIVTININAEAALTKGKPPPEAGHLILPQALLKRKLT